MPTRYAQHCRFLLRGRRGATSQDMLMHLGLSVDWAVRRFYNSKKLPISSEFFN